MWRLVPHSALTVVCCCRNDFDLNGIKFLRVYSNLYLKQLIKMNILALLI